VLNSDFQPHEPTVKTVSGLLHVQVFVRLLIEFYEQVASSKLQWTRLGIFGLDCWIHSLIL